MRRRDFIALAGAALAGVSASPKRSLAAPRSSKSPMTSPEVAPPGPGDPRWRTLRIGAGGFLVGMDVAPDGTLLARTDTYGAWIWQPEPASWRQLVTISSMPAEDRSEDSVAQSWPYEVVAAPSDTSRLYMALGGFVYRSSDRGFGWSKAGSARLSGMNGDTLNSRTHGRRMAVDPRNPDIVYFAPPKGSIVSTSDGGKTWKRVAAIPEAGRRPGQAVGGLVIFDPASRALDGRTSTIYASAWGDGVFRSNDAGRSWRPVPGGPSGVIHAAVAADGALYAVGADERREDVGIFRFDGAWADITPPPFSGQVWHSVTVSPHDPGRIVACKEEGSLCESLDAGRSWNAPIPREELRREADDIPWLAWTDEPWMTNGDVRFDPLVPNRLLFAQGMGVWTADFAPRSRSITWRSRSRSIEQLVSNQCVHAPHPDAKPLLACWDRAIWRVTEPEAYPDRHYPDSRFSHCWGIDYASSDPAFVVATISSQQASDSERSSFSTDGGRNWRPFDGYPSWTHGRSGKGFIAASTPRNMVWSPSESAGLPHYTADGGATWKECALPGVEASDAAGFGWANFIRRFSLCADRRTPGVFYMLHHPKGFFVTEDGGETWALRHDFLQWNERFHTKLRAVPGFSGHLFHTGGHSSAIRHGAFIRSIDGGRSWTALPDVVEVVDFAFGTPAPGADYPSIYIVGYVAGLWGVFGSFDGCATWRRLGDGFPTGSLDAIVAIEADKHAFGTLYVGLAGSGWVYGSPEA